MTNQVLVVASIFLLPCTSALGIPFPTETRYKIKANNVYLGTVDGKSFFSQMTPTMTWDQAKGNCTESNMQLASITSIDERTLLNQAYNDVTFHGQLWTSGRDALSPNHMVWDLSETAVNETVASTYHANSGILTCLALDVPNKSDSSFHFDAESCNSQYGAICEINHGKSSITIDFE